MTGSILAAPLAALALALSAAPPPPAPPAPVASASPAAVALARQVQAYYQGTRDLTARFTQTYTYAGLGRRLVSTGTLEVKKPGRMRWDYATPSPKTIAVAGHRLVQYEPEEGQAVVDERFDATAMSAAVAFLLGRGDLLADFVPALGPGGALLLEPRVADPRVRSLALDVGPGGEVRATTVRDGAGNENRVELDGVRRNTGIPDGRFEVALPAGVRLLGR